MNKKSILEIQSVYTANAFDIDGVTIKMVSDKIQYVLYAAFSPWSQEKRLAQANMMAGYLQAPPEERPKFEKYGEE